MRNIHSIKADEIILYYLIGYRIVHTKGTV